MEEILFLRPCLPWPVERKRSAQKRSNVRNRLLDGADFMHGSIEWSCLSFRFITYYTSGCRELAFSIISPSSPFWYISIIISDPPMNSPHCVVTKARGKNVEYESTGR